MVGNLQVGHAYKGHLVNERDFGIPSKPRPAGIAVCYNRIRRWKCQFCHQLFQMENSIKIVTVAIDLAKNAFCRAWRGCDRQARSGVKLL